MAVIKNLTKGNNGNVQAAEMRTSGERTNQPIARLYPLEISSEKNEVVNTGAINNQDDDRQCTDDINEHSPLMAHHKLCC